jgi:hypothetical protein
MRGKNIYLRSNGLRQCRKCQKLYQLAYRNKKEK